MLNFEIEHPDSRKNSSTFWADICLEYEDWCKINCVGEYSVTNVATICFERYDDALEFINKFWTVRIKAL